MPGALTVVHWLLYVGLPYAAMFLLGAALMRRYVFRPTRLRRDIGRSWSLPPVYYAILVVLSGHLLGMLAPRTVLAWNSRPLPLYALEVSALALGICTVVGVLELLTRRPANHTTSAVSGVFQRLRYGVLFVQVAGGVYIAVFHSWGTSWFAALAAPYLWSMVLLCPDTIAVTQMPHAVQLHIVNAFLLIALFAARTGRV